MKRLFLALAFVLCASSAFADCIEVPIVNSAPRGKPGDYDPQIPAGLPNDYVTDGIPTVNGVPKFPTTIVCFRDSVKIPARLGPMTRDQAAMIIHDRTPATRFNPDGLKMPEQRGFIQGLLDRARWKLSRYVGAALAFAGTGTDNFDRADNTDLGANWDPYDNPSSAPCQILGNAVENTTALVDCVEGFNNYIPTANQYAQITVSGLASGTRWNQVIVRLQAPSTYSGYVCRAQPTDQTNTTRIRRADAGSMSTLVNETATTWADGDVLRCEASGSSITAKRNGATLISGSDATYGSGRGGIGVLDNTDFFSSPLDNFEVGDLGGAAVVRHRPLVIQ